MYARILLPLVLAIAFTVAADAQNNTSSAPNQSTNQSSETANQHKITESIRSQLQSAGFTDVQVMATSFLVTAKDKNGHPVMMRIGPNSATVLAEVPINGGATTGSGSSDQGGSSGSTTQK
jgi:hypothetical protein